MSSEIQSPTALWWKLFPTRALALLMLIGFADLVATAVLHSQGLIVELNPLMRGLIERSEWLFAMVKATTLVAAWSVMVWYAPQNRLFVRRACLAGSAVYMVIWSGWVMAGMMA